jgi:hypothetical protein
MELRPCSAYTVPHYMTHQSRPQISIESCIVSTTSYRMEQVLCQTKFKGSREWTAGKFGQGQQIGLRHLLEQGAASINYRLKKSR